MSDEHRERHSSGPLDDDLASSSSHAGHTHICAICEDSKPPAMFPSIFDVEGHDHNNDVCTECFTSHLEIEVETKMWNQVSCPQCPLMLQREEIHILASAETWTRYQQFAQRAALSENPAYRYCFSTSCDSGQVHDGELVFACQSCGHCHCTVCNTNWHENDTCEQYQARHQARQQAEAASEVMVQSTTKPCPACNSNIEKIDGCDHMICKSTLFVSEVLN